MTVEVDQILEWEHPRKGKVSLLFVVDTSLPEDDVDKKRIEIAEYDNESDRWETVETVSHVKELSSYGIPESLVD